MLNKSDHQDFVGIKSQLCQFRHVASRYVVHQQANLCTPQSHRRQLAIGKGSPEPLDWSETESSHPPVTGKYLENKNSNGDCQAGRRHDFSV